MYQNVIQNTKFLTCFIRIISLCRIKQAFFFSFQCMLKILFCTCFSIFKNYVQKDLKNGFSKSARYSDWHTKYAVVAFLQIFEL